MLQFYDVMTMNIALLLSVVQLHTVNGMAIFSAVGVFDETAVGLSECFMWALV